MHDAPCRYTHALLGCTPEPLIHYLKSLGIMRTVARQKDKDARGWWENEIFYLSTAISAEDLTDFFIDEYNPTPIVAPWNSGGGFYGDAALKFLENILNAEEERYREYIEIIAMCKRILVDLDLKYGRKQQKKLKEVKRTLIERCRAELPDSFVELMDVTLALTDDKPYFAPLMGTGGNDGRLDFTSTHMEYLQQIIPVRKEDVTSKKYKQNRVLNLARLQSALFMTEAVKFEKGSSGQFFPGSVGGPNSSTTGCGGVNLVNPWDYVLAMEGLFLFAGSVSRQLEHQVRGSSFPFTVRGTSAAGWATITSDDADKGSRGEIWLPLWKNPATFAEISYLFSEGRARVGQKTARSGIDFARAIASLGIDRGIDSFQRIGFLSGSRSGKMYFASSMGLFPVAARPMVRLLDETDWWVDRLRNECYRKETPARYRNALKNIEDAAFAYCRHGGPRRLQEIIIALGQASQGVALNRDMQKNMPPLSLSPRWIIPLDDGTSEFRIAAAVASIHDYDGEGRSIRENLEPIVQSKGGLAWENTNYHVEVSDLPRTLLAILEKRSLRRTINTNQLPLAGRLKAGLADIRHFLDGKLAEKRILDLLIGMSLIRWQYAGKEDLPQHTDTGRTEIYPVFALLKLLFLPASLSWPPGAEPVHIKTDYAVLGRLRTGDLASAIRMALGRLTASGFTPHVKPRDASQFAVLPVLKKRLGASLIIPVGNWSELAGKILIRPELENQKPEGVVL